MTRAPRLAPALAALVLSAAPAAAQEVALYDDLGSHHYAVTATPQAQRWFDQGLRLYYAFNHAEAIVAFREATRLDPRCALCPWGTAMAYGPNINLPMDSASGVAAYAALREAQSRRQYATPREQALIDALALRYRAEPPADRAALDSAYAQAMAGVAARFADDPEAAVLAAESVMDLSPWNYWTQGGQPRPQTEALLASLERVMETAPDHPGACHFYIHAVEAVHPDRAVPCAERLAALMPGAGHLVHMPGHIYIRVGRYADAIRANEHAVHADETFIRDRRPEAGVYTLGYYPHNYDFLAFAAMMAGRRGQAVQAAHTMASQVPPEMVGTPGMGFLQNQLARPLQVMVRFGAWDDVMAAPEPAARAPYTRALWHYARGRALAARGDANAADAELAALREIAAAPGMAESVIEYNVAGDLLAVAEHVLAGHVSAARGDHDAAAQHLEEAARREDALTYGEPPEWSVPVRQELGALLLGAGRPADAEAAFRADLRRFPDNGWSLHGLVAALRAQGRADDAARTEADFRRAWEGADVQPHDHGR